MLYYNTVLAKTKYYINQNELISLYHATFSSLLLYGCQDWSPGNQNNIEVLQNSAMRIISNDYGHVSPPYQAFNILNLKDNITKNVLLIHDFLTKKLPISLKYDFTTYKDLYTMITRNAQKGFILSSLSSFKA